MKQKNSLSVEQIFNSSAAAYGLRRFAETQRRFWLIHAATTLALHWNFGMVGTRVGPYRILRQVHEDSLGQVFEAVDLASKKTVAIRALNNDIANRPETVARLHSEAKTLALLNHPHIARTFGFIRDSGGLFLVTEFLEGETLQSLLKAKCGLEAPVALAYFHQLLSAVSFAHNLGVIHGDLNPASVLITHFGQVKVLDFTRALLLREQDPARLDDDGEFHAAPEQLRGEPADERSDLYSLGALFYHCLTGRRPFDCVDAIRAHARGASTLLPPSLLTANCPPWLDDFVLRALAPAVADRFQTAAAMDRAMDMRVKSGMRVPARKPTSWPRIRGMAQTARSAGWQPRRAQKVAAGQLRAGFERARRTTSRLGHDALVKMNPLEPTRRCVSRMNSGLTAARAAMKKAQRRVQRQAAYARRYCSEKAARLDFLANSAGGSLREKFSERWNSRKFGHLTQGACLGVGTSIRRIRPKLAALSEIGWQRYAAVAIVLSSAMIEIFVFGGANALLMFDRSQGPAVVQHGAAQSFIEPAAEKAVAPLRQVSAAPREAPAPKNPANRASTGRKPPARSRSENENEYLEARVARRVVTYRLEAKTPPPTESRVSDPPRKRSDYPPQLNVKWEN